MKKCPTCKKDKPLSDFYKNRVKKDGYARVCKICIKPIMKDQWTKHKNKRRKQRRMHKYGISAEKVENMFSEQNRSCAICQKVMDENIDKICLDHCHITGKIRALLCDTCNKGIGFFGDNPKCLRAAANYIEKHQTTLEVQNEFIKV